MKSIIWPRRRARRRAARASRAAPRRPRASRRRSRGWPAPSAIARSATPGGRPGSDRSGSSVTASPRATSARLIDASLVRWRMSGSKPPSSRQVRSVISSQPMPRVAGRPRLAGQLGQRHRRGCRRAAGWSAGSTSCTGSSSRSWRSTPGGSRRGWCCHSSPSTRSTSPSASAGSDCSGSASTSSQRRPRRVARERLASPGSRGAAPRTGSRRSGARPATVPAAAASSASASAARSSSASAWPTSTSAASVRRTPRPARSSSGTPASRSSIASCWETAEGVNWSASATAAIVPRSSQLAQQPQAAKVEHQLANATEYPSGIGIAPDALARHDRAVRPLRNPHVPRLGRRVRRDGDLRQARLRRGRDRRHAARPALRARRGAVLAPDRGDAARRARCGRSRRRDVRRWPGARRLRLRARRPAPTSPRCGASTRRCWRCCSTRSRRSSRSPRSRSAASASTRRRRSRSALASSGIVLVVAGAGTGALDPVGARARPRRGARLQRLHPDQRRHRRARRTALARRARLHRRGGHADGRARPCSASCGPGALTAAGLGLARVPRGRLDRRRDQPLLRRPAPRRADRRAAILSTVEPLVTVVLASLVFGETLGPLQLAGGMLVLAAVPVLHARRVATHRPPAPAPATLS